MFRGIVWSLVCRSFHHCAQPISTSETQQRARSALLCTSWHVDMHAMQRHQQRLLRQPTPGSVFHRAVPVCRRPVRSVPKAADVAVSETSEAAGGSQRGSSLIIGCRGSKLSLQQAQQVQEMLAHANAECLHTPSNVQEIATRGDTSSAESLRAMGPGAFTEAIDEAVAAGDVDIGVHSLKDSPLLLPEGVTLKCCLPREDPRDALISKGGLTLAQLPPGSRVGTSSMRRRAQVLAAYPHLQVVPLRGSVHSRMLALNEGKVEATILAAAGLKRLGLLDKVAQVFELEEMLPAACQGTIGVTCRTTDQGMIWDLSLISHEPTEMEVKCERAALHQLLLDTSGSDSDSSGSDSDKPAGESSSAARPHHHHQPYQLPHFAIAINAKFEPSTGMLICRGLVASPDGKVVERRTRSHPAGRPADAEWLGAKVGRKLRRAAAKHNWYGKVAEADADP